MNLNFFDIPALDLFINLVLFSLIILIVSVGANLIVAAIWPKIKVNTNFYLYAFSTGLLVIIGTLGLLGEGIEASKEYVDKQTFSNKNLIAALIVISGALLGIVFSIGLRYLLSSKFKIVHKHHELHDHSDHIINTFDVDNPKAAWLVIGLLLAHRSIDGFTLGALIPKIMEQLKNPDTANPINIGFFVAFFIHIIFEAIFIYYRQIQYKQTKWKAILYNFYTLVALAVIIIIGGFIYKPVTQTGWILPLANGFGGIVITFVSVLEIVPEFIHFRNADAKRWYITIGWFGLGLLMALALISLENM